MMGNGRELTFPGTCADFASVVRELLAPGYSFMQDTPLTNPLFKDHPRTYAANRYVYPVLSRRAGGISIGVNLNIDKFCNFHCIYCQVDRSSLGEKHIVDLDRLADELSHTIDLVVSGRIFEGPQFRDTPPSLRRLNDIALSGDGEPTAYANFPQVVDVCAEVRRRHGLDGLKLVLITNASLLHRPQVCQALTTLDANGGEIWAKLDAGTEEYYRLVAQSAVPWRQILDNLREAAIVRPIIIQTLWMRIHGESPTATELSAYCQRLQDILAGGGRIKLVQIHTVARKPAESWVEAISNAEVDAIADLVRSRTGLPVAAFYGGGETK
jgi:wyosine [tRNA(Phe)-imidazoG37] synthetase (radical SAM superfamily)